MSAPSFTYSGNIYTAGVAGTVDFPLTSTTGNAIPYLEPSHIHVYKSVDSGGTWTELSRPSQWDFTSSGTVARLVAGIAAGEWVKVQRITPSTTAYVTFQASSLLTAEQLNSDTLFNAYLNQEGIDQGDQSALVASAAETAADAATAAANTATATANAATTAANAATSASTAATATANQAATDAAAAVATANTASTNASAAVSTANTASTNASNAVTTANTASANASTALTTANTADANASTALSTANTAATNATTAIATANTAASNASTALSTANTADTNATAALAAATTASTNASAAVTTANAADVKADQAISAVSSALLFTIVSNVAAIPASPTDGDAVEVTNSTGIESFTPLTGIPPGFVGDSGLGVRIIYEGAGATWNWLQYFPIDPDKRYAGPNTPAGTVSAPSIAFGPTDTNTGIFSPGADELALVTGGVARLTFDSAGAATFSNSVTIPAGSTVTGYLDTTTAASTYQTQAGMSGYVATSDIGTTVQAYDATILKSADIGVSIQAYDATTLKSADIGVSIQAYDANLPAGNTILVDGDVGVVVQAYDATILKSADIGTSVQAYDADTAKLDVAQTFTAQQTFGELKETVYTLGTSGSISLNPANGSIQRSVLTGAPTFTDALEAGQTVVLMLENGASYSVTWPTTTWVTSGGNVAPTLTAKDTLVFWKVSTTLYGAYVGSYV